MLVHGCVFSALELEFRHRLSQELGASELGCPRPHKGSGDEPSPVLHGLGLGYL